MAGSGADADEEREWRWGGRIPGAETGGAFALAGGDRSPIPVLIAVPHAGRAYPPALLERLRDPELAAARLEDRHADALARAVARATGAMLLVAHAPRAMIDLNRAPDDIDWEMFGRGPGPGAERAGEPGARRARAGLGLIPRRLPGLGELWKRRHERAELDARVAAIHAPYHACAAAALARLRARWGAALLIDLHSMPSLSATADGEPARIVIGDRFGASCDGALTAACFDFLAERGCRAAHNRPYAGGYGIERHGRPGEASHALQIEVDRASYLNARGLELGEGFAGVAALLAELVRRLAQATASLARDAGAWAQAAE